MSAYVDTSIIVTALTSEPRAVQMLAWLADTRNLFVSWWTGPEFASALARKRRERNLDGDIVLRATRAFDRLIADGFTTLPVTRSDFAKARSLVDDPAAALRASDALHLAVAAAHGLELATLDKRMASGGAAVGVATLLL